MKRAIYPGTFDPITNGHLDVLKRACKIFDEVIAVVATNRDKNPMFTMDERIELIAASISDLPRVKATGLEDSLSVDFAKELGATAIIRGLRAVSDFEYEFQMAQMNRMLDADIETVFFMPNEAYFFTSSNLVKSVSAYELERIRSLLPPPVYDAISAKRSKQA